jgi:CRP-like cAMP-binding protein
MSGSVTDLKQALAAVWMFSDLTEAERDGVASLARHKRVVAKTVIVSKGEPADEFYVILRGKAKVTAHSADGSETGFAVMASGEVFGETALLDGGLRSATVTAMVDCELACFERAEFLALLRRNPELSIRLLGVMARRLRALSSRVEERAFLSVSARLAHQLLALSQGDADGAVALAMEPRSIEVRASQEELAALVGAGRERVNRQLREWERSHWVRLGRGRIVIQDTQAIRRLARLT